MLRERERGEEGNQRWQREKSKRKERDVKEREIKEKREREMLNIDRVRTVNERITMILKRERERE